MRAHDTPAMMGTASYLRDRAPGKITLILFLLSLPLSIRKVFMVISPYGPGGFNEYTDISLYLSDILLGAFLCVLLQNKNSILSISWWKGLFHVEQAKLLLLAPLPFLFWAGLSIFWSESYLLAFYSWAKLVEGYLLYASLILLIVPRGTILQNNDDCSTWNNSKPLELDKCKMFHVEQLEINKHDQALFSEENVPRGTIQNPWNWINVKCSTWNIWKIIFIAFAVIGFIEALVAIFQFIFQSSLGFTFLKESIFSSSERGIAKIVFQENASVRAYGLFPHPNILGGFLGITILFTIAYPIIFGKKMFHVEQSSKDLDNVPRGTIRNLWNWTMRKCSTWNNLKYTELAKEQLFHVEQSIILYRVVLGVQIIGFLVAFSKSALLGLVVAAIYYIYGLFHVEQSIKNSENVPRGTFGSVWNWIWVKCSTWNNPSKIQKMFHVEHFIYLFLALIMVITSVLFLKRIDWYYFFTQPLAERLFLQSDFILILSHYFVQGVGIGQSVLVMQSFFSETLLSWQFQPVHNVYLLITSETGFIGIILFLLFITSLVRGNVPRGTFENKRRQYLFKAMILFIAVVSCFDHYFWDIQQGQILLWFVLGCLAASSLESEDSIYLTE